MTTWLRPAAILALVAASLTATVSPAAPVTVSFAQAVTRALSANPRVGASAALEQAAEGQVRVARGHALPSLRFQFTAGRSNDPLTVLGYRLAQHKATFSDLGLGSFAGPDSLSIAPDALDRPGYSSNFDSAVILTMPLFAGGGNLAQLHAAKAKRAAAAANKTATRTQLTFEVLRTYNGVTAARLLIDAAETARRAAKDDVKTAYSLFRRGLVIKSDVLLARANLEQAVATEQAARAAYQDMLDAFHTTIGATSTRAPEPGNPVDIALPTTTLRALQETALESNPQIQALRERVIARVDERKAAEAENWPRVDLVVRHDWNAAQPALRAPSNTIMGVVSWNVFTSGAQQGGTQAASAELRAARDNLAAAEDALRLEIAQRYRATQVTAAQARAAVAAAAQAAESAHLLALRYAQGLVPIDNLLNAQARRDHARAEAVEASYQAVLARAALRAAMGDLDPQAAAVRPLVPAGGTDQPSETSDD